MASLNHWLLNLDLAILSDEKASATEIVIVEDIADVIEMRRENSKGKTSFHGILKQVAKRLGMPDGTVRNAWYRFRTRNEIINILKEEE